MPYSVNRDRFENLVSKMFAHLTEEIRKKYNESMKLLERHPSELIEKDEDMKNDMERNEIESDIPLDSSPFIALNFKPKDSFA